MTFQIHALPYARFAPFFAMSPQKLAEIGAHIETVTRTPDKPCRVSLEDASPGERALLVNHTHLAANSPYAARHAIWVREGARTAQLAPGEVPQMLAHRALSVRGFDRRNMMIEADLVQGDILAEALNRQFSVSAVETVHIHCAGPGCFVAEARRA